MDRLTHSEIAAYNARRQPQNEARPTFSQRAQAALGLVTCAFITYGASHRLYEQAANLDVTDANLMVKVAALLVIGGIVGTALSLRHNYKLWSGTSR